jgi:hypothetical protein
MLRCCPACSRRAGSIVDDECPVCAGAGVLELGRAALARFGSDVTSRAVEINLEGAARFALAALNMTPEKWRGALSAAVAQLRLAGVLAGGPPIPPQAQPVHDDDVPVTVTLDAPPLVWAVDDRPVSVGAVGFSAAGYISRLARAADPLDLMGPSTTQVAARRQVVDQEAARLAAAAATF